MVFCEQQIFVVRFSHFFSLTLLLLLLFFVLPQLPSQIDGFERLDESVDANRPERSRDQHLAPFDIQEVVEQSEIVFVCLLNSVFFVLPVSEAIRLEEDPDRVEVELFLSEVTPSEYLVQIGDFAREATKSIVSIVIE
jgi:hypothetical protein